MSVMVMTISDSTLSNLKSSLPFFIASFQAKRSIIMAMSFPYCLDIPVVFRTMTTASPPGSGIQD
jgi:hypothetical protein